MELFGIFILGLIVGVFTGNSIQKQIQIEKNREKWRAQSKRRKATSRGLGKT